LIWSWRLVQCETKTDRTVVRTHGLLFDGLPRA
jgi:hypothetical protein